MKKKKIVYTIAVVVALVIINCIPPHQIHLERNGAV